MQEMPPNKKASTNAATSRRGMSVSTQLILLVIPVVLVIGGWVFWQQLRQSPTRQSAVQVPPYGLITVQLTTNPFPPLTTGTVQMTLRLQTPGGQMAMVDRVTYSYGPVDGDQVFEGQAKAVGMEVYQGPLRFATTGDWWIKVRIENQGTSDEATFTLPVVPAL
jgi:hypothetical protein